MNITNSTIEDIPQIQWLYAKASEHMRMKNMVVWPTFTDDFIQREILQHMQWKITIDNSIACVWMTTFSDPKIWEEQNADPAVYIHRIATNPNFRGNNFVGVIVEWAKQFAKENNKQFVRLDTVGENTALIKHYTTNGFNFLGMRQLKTTEGLPEHYNYGPACLFELEIK